MEIRDIIHGSIAIDAPERAIVDSRIFQRLRLIKQLGFAENSFPSATHNRYVHSLGAMHTAAQAFDSIFGNRSAQGGPQGTKGPKLSAQPLARLRRVVRLAALLHDVGHGPLSHTTEFAMPAVETLGLPSFAQKNRKGRKATHEDYTLKLVLDSPLTAAIDRAGSDLGFKSRHVASLIDSEITPGDEFFCEVVDGSKIDFMPILRQLVSSELDADRMDYLRRDSQQTGVSYGQFDFNWIVTHLTSHVQDGHCYLGIQHRALYALEDFLISRYHMFLMVYFHYKSTVYDEMLKKYLCSSESTYSLPADIEAYCECTDAQLFAHLSASQNEWARRIVEKRPYRMLVELHSGIPATKTAALEQKRLLLKIEKELIAQEVPYLSTTATGELSKYFRKPGDPIFVRYDNLFSQPSWIPLEQCTDLFQRYSEKREITRLYVSPENYSLLRGRGREIPLPYEDLEENLSLPFA